MKPRYEDILALAGDREPDWWDEHAVPRYAPYRPWRGYPTDSVAALFVVACSSCHRRFLVGAGSPRHVFGHHGRLVEVTLRSFIDSFDFGDAPRHDLPGIGRCAGETMSTDMLTVKEAWERHPLEWERRPAYEGLLSGLGG